MNNSSSSSSSSDLGDFFAPVYADVRSQLLFAVTAFLTMSLGNYLLAVFACYVGRNQYVVLTDRLLGLAAKIIVCSNFIGITTCCFR